MAKKYTKFHLNPKSIRIYLFVFEGWLSPSEARVDPCAQSLEQLLPAGPTGAPCGFLPIWRFPKSWGYPVPQNRWFIMETPIKMDENWGYPHDLGTPHLVMDIVIYLGYIWIVWQGRYQSWRHDTWNWNAWSLSIGYTWGSHGLIRSHVLCSPPWLNLNS
jgi:hypothetical protein